MEIRFLPAGCGDAIHVRFEGTDNQYHNILIDGGMERNEIYSQGIRRALQFILDRGEQIDLWIITHIDDDHIGGILRFIRDNDIFFKFDLSKTEFWYNWWHLDYPIQKRSGTRKSVKQAIRLRSFLEGKGRVNQSITNENDIINLFGVTITILSPNAETFRNLIGKWRKEEVRLIKKQKQTKKKRSKHDYNELIDSFDVFAFREDTSAENGSSIAFLLQYNRKAILFAADSFPSVIAQSLRKLGFTSKNPIVLDYMQLGHHGSRFNTSRELIQLIDCRDYIVSANGFNNASLPHKETFARVMQHRSNLPTNFYITHENSRTSIIFTVDKGLTTAQLIFPKNSSHYLSFTL